MHIEIDYDGSVARCTLSGCLPSASCPNVSPFETYNFNDADHFSQIFALDAFRTIKEHHDREVKLGHIKGLNEYDSNT